MTGLTAKVRAPMTTEPFATFIPNPACSSKRAANLAAANQGTKVEYAPINSALGMLIGGQYAHEAIEDAWILKLIGRMVDLEVTLLVTASNPRCSRALLRQDVRERAFAQSTRNGSKTWWISLSARPP